MIFPVPHALFVQTVRLVFFALRCSTCLREGNAAEGVGRFMHANGDSYVGEWKSNLAHGHLGLARQNSFNS